MHTICIIEYYLISLSELLYMFVKECAHILSNCSQDWSTFQFIELIIYYLSYLYNQVCSTQRVDPHRCRIYLLNCN